LTAGQVQGDRMRDEWFPYIVFPISWEQFHQLPKNPIDKWEYWDGKAHLTARPKPYHCLLTLHSAAVVESVDVGFDETITIRKLREDDWKRLSSIFVAAFGQIPPFCGMEEAVAQSAAESCLKKDARRQ